MKLKFTATAIKDLNRLREFIATKNPVAASKYIDRLLKVIRQLAHQPNLGKELESFPAVRQIVAGDYVVQYAIKEETVFLLKIWHGKEDR